MLLSLPHKYLYCLSIVISALISIYAVRKIIFITRKRKIFDIPDNIRKIHGEQIPSLGGIGVFIGYMATVPFFVTSGFNGLNFIIISSVILFFTGVYDDIMNMRPSKKLIAQLLATAVTVYFADIRISSLYGLLGINELPFWLSIGLTTFLGTFFINVFNFIDGIDGLAGMLCMLYTLIFGIHFASQGLITEACVALSLLGATLGLLWFNYAPAKIYMGDTGSMLIGFSVFILSLLFIRSTGKIFLPEMGNISAGKIAIETVMAILFLPVFDALRVFALRLSKGISPLQADRRHLHYYLLDAGLSHAATAWLLVGVNIITIVVAFGCIAAKMPVVVFFLCIALPSVIASVVASRLRKAKA